MENLTEELNNVARNTIKTYEDGTFAEQENVRKQLQKFENECADIFKHYIGVVPSKVIDDITIQTNDLLKKEIGQSRTTECRDTVQRLGNARTSSVQGMSDGIERFKNEGVAKDNSYEQKVDEISDRVIKAYRSVLERAPSKGADMAFDEIRGHSRRTFNNIKEVHEECTKVIEKTVLAKVEEFGISLSNSEIEHIQSESSKVALDFGEELQSNCVSKEELILNDTEELSKNKENDEPIKNSRSELEAKFK